MKEPKSWSDVTGTKHVNSTMVGNTVSEAMALAYGLLWTMRIDRRDANMRRASDARIALSNAMTMDQRGRGIAAARSLIQKHYRDIGFGPDEDFGGEFDALWQSVSGPSDTAAE